MPSIRTENLEMAYQVSGPGDCAPLILLHGWPDAAGTIRDRRSITLAQDAIDLADALKLDTFAVA